MAKLLRKTCIPFGLSGASTNFGQFGSKQAGLPQTSQDPAVIQALSAWIDGWTTAVVTSNKAAYIEDMNGFCLVAQYMSAYLYEMGIPEWDAATTYFIGSVVQGPAGGASASQWFQSLQDNNLGNAPPASADNAFWKWANRPLPSSFGFGNAIKANYNLRPNAGAPTTKVDFSADIISVLGVSLTSVMFTIDDTVVGANGLDSGTLAANQKYAVHAITNDTGLLVGGLLSLSATAPTLPAGYTKFRRIGWIFIGAGPSKLIIQFFQQGDWWWFVDPVQFSFAAINGTLSFATAVPPTSRLAAFTSLIQSGVALDGHITMKVTGTSQPATTVQSTFNTGATFNQNHATWNFPTDPNQQIDTAISGSIGPLIVLGYYDPI